MGRRKGWEGEKSLHLVNLALVQASASTLGGINENPASRKWEAGHIPLQWAYSRSQLGAGESRRWCSETGLSKARLYVWTITGAEVWGRVLAPKADWGSRPKNKAKALLGRLGHLTG